MATEASSEKPKKAKKVRRPARTEAWRTRPVGYPSLSERMGVKPETLIFRKFVALNARMLLYMQAELVMLEKELQVREERDRDDTEGNRNQYATNYSCLLMSCKDGDTTQLELVNKIQEKLKDYNKALLRHHKLSKIPEPDHFDLKDMQALLSSKAVKLIGTDHSVWGSIQNPALHAPDLICVAPREDVDTFSRVVSQKAIYLFKCGLGRIKKPDPHLGHVFYDTTFIKLTRWLTASIASLLPIAAVVVLTNQHSQQTKLWTIAAFNVVFTLSLTICTKAKPAEVFAITAAFAAVQVVFLGQEHNN